MEFEGQTADGHTIRYRDGKRYLWLLSLTGGFHVAFAIALYYATGGNPWTLLYPLAYTFIGVPIIDALMGEDGHNPPEEVVRPMARDNYYRALLYAGIGLLFATFFLVAWFLGTHDLHRAQCRTSRARGHPGGLCERTHGREHL